MKLKLLANVYREHGTRGTLALLRYWVARAITLVRGPGRECPACGWRGREFRPLLLLPEGVIRTKAVCPACSAWERQRMTALYLPRLLARYFPNRAPSVLHFSPESSLRPLLEQFAGRYDRSDLESPQNGDLSLDLQNLTISPGTYDAFVMNGVLTCVPDDARAVASMYRALGRGGIVLACEPVRLGARTEHWGPGAYRDAYRSYGSVDLAERLAPFEVQLVDIGEDGVTAAERKRFGLESVNHLILLRKTDDASRGRQRQVDRVDTGAHASATQASSSRAERSDPA